jgi:hypothetical protein
MENVNRRYWIDVWIGNTLIFNQQVFRSTLDKVPGNVLIFPRFSSASAANSGIVPRPQLLPSKSLAVYQSSCHSTRYNLYTDSVLIWQTQTIIEFCSDLFYISRPSFLQKCFVTLTWLARWLQVVAKQWQLRWKSLNNFQLRLCNQNVVETY